MAQPKSRKINNLPDVEDNATRERLAAIASDVSSLETMLNNLSSQEDTVFDPTHLRRLIYQLRYDFDRHEHPEYGRRGGDSLSSNPFYTALKAGTTDTVTVNAGVLVRGTNVTLISEADVDISPSGTDAYYVYLESWYNAALKQQYSSSTVYPTQATINDGGTHFPCERFLIAIADVTDAEITGVIPCQFNELHSTRLWE